jgi:NADH-quinone oxidoreductase subunit J
MVLFLFVVMMIRVESSEEVMFPLSQWLPAAIFGLIYLAAAVAMIVETPGTEVSLRMLSATPRQFALYVFEHHWFSIEVISILLLLALIGALRLGTGKGASLAGGRAGSISTPREAASTAVEEEI